MRLSGEKIKRIIELHEEGLSSPQIAERLGIYTTTVSRHLRNHRKSLENAVTSAMTSPEITREQNDYPMTMNSNQYQED